MVQSLMLQAADNAPDITLYERALSQVVAMKMAERDDVKRFRVEHLEGHVIAWEGIADWIQRHEPAQGVHAASYYVTLPLPDEAMRDYLLAYVQGVIEDRELDIRVPLRDLFLKREVRPLVLLYLVPGEEAPRKAVVRSGTVLEDLQLIAQRLTSATTWTEAQAVVFVLADVAPLIRQFTFQIEEDAELPALTRVTLQVDPRSSQRELARHFQAVRQTLFRARHRDISAKHLTLALFSTTLEGRTGSLAGRMNRWNEQHPGWAYRHATNFSRDIGVALRRLLGSGYDVTPAREADEENEGGVDDGSQGR